jgi:hypothetical protein
VLEKLIKRLERSGKIRRQKAGFVQIKYTISAYWAYIAQILSTGKKIGFKAYSQHGNGLFVFSSLHLAPYLPAEAALGRRALCFLSPQGCRPLLKLAGGVAIPEGRIYGNFKK